MSEVGDENALSDHIETQRQREEITMPCDVEQKMEDSQVEQLHCSGSDCESDTQRKGM